MTKSACIGKEEGCPLLSEMWRGCGGWRVFRVPTRRKQRDHGAAVRLSVDGGRRAAVISEKHDRNVDSTLNQLRENRNDGRTLCLQSQMFKLRHTLNYLRHHLCCFFFPLSAKTQKTLAISPVNELLINDRIYISVDISIPRMLFLNKGNNLMLVAMKYHRKYASRLKEGSRILFAGF